MGYILPVTPYSYHNYQRRVMKKAKSPYHIGRKPPVSFQEVVREKESETKALRELYLNVHEDKVNMEHINKTNELWYATYPLASAEYMRPQKGQQVNIQI